MSKKNGGPAFPRPGMRMPNGEMDWPEHGMTLRDWFAGQALQALILREEQNRPEEGFALGNGGVEDFANVACSAYMAADAMLRVRGGEQ